MRENAVLRKSPDMVSRIIDDETILLPLYKSSEEINCIYTLNKPASRVWELIDSKKTVKDIKKVILKEFDTTPEEADKEMAKVLKDLRQIKAIVS